MFGMAELPVGESFIVSALQCSKVVSWFQFVCEAGDGAASTRLCVYFLQQRRILYS